MSISHGLDKIGWQGLWGHTESTTESSINISTDKTMALTHK
jgi:hypothetical protein